MKKTHIRIASIFLILLIATTGIFVPTKEANAGWCNLMPGCLAITQGVNLAGVLYNLWGATVTNYTGPIKKNDLFSSTYGVVSFAMSKAISWSTTMPTPPSVEESWKIVRNVVNMFFILILIIMAFGTIFDIHGYTIKDMFKSFLVSIILINFSFTITTYVFVFSNDLALVFINTTKQAFPGQNDDEIFATIVNKGINYQSKTMGTGDFLLQAGKCAVGKCGTGKDVVRFFGGMAFSLISIFKLIVVVLFILFRNSWIWILAILSPIAWFGYALPNIKKATWGSWWDHFLGWCFWLPSYLFVFMIMAIVLNLRPILQPQQDKGFLGIMTFDDMAYFGFTIFVLIGGLMASFQVGKLFKGGAVKGAQWAHSVTKRIPIPIGDGKNISLSDIEGGAKKTWGEVQERGLPGRLNWLFGGKRAGEVGENFIAEKLQGALGYTPSLQGQKALAHAIEEEMERLKKSIHSKEDFDKQIESASGYKRKGLLLLQAENGWFAKGDAGKKQLSDALKELGGGASVLGHHFIRALEKADFRDIFANPQDRIDFARASHDHELENSLYRSVAKKLPSEQAVMDYLELTKKAPAEEREKAKEAAKASIAKLIKSTSDRQKELVSATRFKVIDPATGRPRIDPATGKDMVNKDAQKLLASLMIENEEITNSQEYYATVGIFGEDNPKIGEMDEKIAKYSPILSAEIQARRANKIPSTTPTSGIPKNILRPLFADALKNNGKKYDKIADASVEEWSSDVFKEVLKSHILELERSGMTYPSHWEKPPGTVISPPAGGFNSGANFKGQVPGAGRRYLEGIRKETANSTQIRIINEIIEIFKLTSHPDPRYSRLGMMWWEE